MEPITENQHVVIQIENDENPYVPEYNIHEERDKCLFGTWVFFTAAFLCAVVGVTLYINIAYFRVIDPEPSFTTTDLVAGCRYDFFHEPKTFNESQRICESRQSNLVVFNNSVEDSRFNQFVDEIFKPFVINQTTNQWKRRGLQIWTGIRIIFQADRLTRLDWPDRMECPMEMLKFYADAQETRLCYATTMDRMRMYRKAMQSRRTNKQYIVKDFTGKFENSLGEMGCWQIRIVDDSEKLLLPFVCKSGSPIPVVTTTQPPPAMPNQSELAEVE